MAALDTDEIQALLRSIVARPGIMTCLGVFAANRIPSLSTIVRRSPVSCQCCFVVNTDPAHQPGKHWIAFVASHNGSARTVAIDYFDSYGLPLATYHHVYDACQRKGWPQIRFASRVMLQNIDSSVCGYYCVLFLHNMCAHDETLVSIIQTLKCLAPNSVERDAFVVRTLHIIMHMHSVELPIAYYRQRRCRQCCCAANTY